jgi:GH15 family glucan-1,4-alpha-glucosidase
MDAAVTFLAPPYAAPDAEVDAAVLTAENRLALPGGGVLPGEHWQGNRTQAWTPETAMFALAAASSGRTGEATAQLDWLAAHRTSLGVLPEKVDQHGHPASVAPLGWTAALVLLALHALDHPLPTPPAD